MPTTLAALALLAAMPQTAADLPPARQFDFWIGEWAVHNRHLQPDGSWSEGEDTRARIAPVCGGAGILEEWAGPWYGGFQNGFSLRAWDPGLERWKLVLFWTTIGRASFGTLEGGFRHGRGEFFSGSPASSWTRYTFSDGLADSLRWDSARSADGGQTWKTDWIMEFSRTRAASEVTQDTVFDEDWNVGSLAPDPAARALDGMVGEWRGTATRRSGDARVELPARLRSRLLNKDALILDVLTLGDGPAPEERLAVRGFEAGPGVWRSWRLESDDPVLRTATSGAAVPTAWSYPLETDGDQLSVLWERPSEDRLVRVETRLDASGRVLEEVVCDLRRVAPEGEGPGGGSGGVR